MNSSESGNVIFIILIAIALFAALSMAVSFSGQTGQGDISREKAQIYSSELMDYAEYMSTAISKLRINGCTLLEINFNNAKVAGYVNASAPANKRCDVFSAEGGGMNWPDFSPEMFDSQWQAQPDFRQPIFTIKNEIPHIGTDGDGSNSYDLLMIVEGLLPSMCDVINERAKNDKTILAADKVETKYNGVINTTATYTFPPSFNGQRQECFRDSSGGDTGTLTYYYAIVVR